MAGRIFLQQRRNNSGGILHWGLHFGAGKFTLCRPLIGYKVFVVMATVNGAFYGLEGRGNKPLKTGFLASIRIHRDSSALCDKMLLCFLYGASVGP